jgi:hypothetical protein
MVKRGTGRLRPVLTWLPVMVLLAGAANHFWQVHRHRLSPWLGAGFGMFATTDVGSARQVHLTAVLADGSEYWVEVGEPYRDTLLRARGLPSETRLARLAEAALRALAQEPGPAFPAPPARLRVEVWTTVYQAGTLRPRSMLLAGASYPVGPATATAVREEAHAE